MCVIIVAYNDPRVIYTRYMKVQLDGHDLIRTAVHYSQHTMRSVAMLKPKTEQWYPKAQQALYTLCASLG